MRVLRDFESPEYGVFEKGDIINEKLISKAVKAVWLKAKIVEEIKKGIKKK